MWVLSRFSPVGLFATPWAVGFSVHGILQARILEWVAIPFSRLASRPRDWTHISCSSCIVGGFFTAEPPRKPLRCYVYRSVMLDSLWPHGFSPQAPLCSRNFPGKNTGVGYHFLLQGIFPTQGWNPSLLHCRLTLDCLSRQGLRPYRWFKILSLLWASVSSPIM